MVSASALFSLFAWYKFNMEKESKKAKSQDGERRKRKRTSSKKDEKKSRGKQKKIDESSDACNSQENQQDKEGGSPSRPTSPENCSICLGDLQNKSFTDSCFHMFCFVCLKEWSKVKAECPLCKQKFKNIIYNVNSYEKFDRYNIEEEANKSRWERDGTRFRYRTTLTFERRLTIGPEHNYNQPIARPSNVTTRSHWRRHREPATSEFRRRIYTNGMQAEEVTDRRLRVRDTTPNFYRQNPATMHRLVPWLNRELNSLLQNQPDHVQLVIEIIMGLIKSHSIDSEDFYQHVYPYVGRHTRHFMHEFSCFAKSPYNMIAYDAQVVYQPGPVTLDSDSNDSTAEIDDEFLDEIIDIEDENSNPRSPQVDRRINHPFSSVSNLSPLFRSVRDILEAESPVSSMTLPLSVSGWDSPTPGPSWMSLGADLELPIPNTTENIPVEGNRASSPIDIASTSDSDSDSTQSADSNGSDIVFVKVDKPWEERSPIMLSSDSSDVERNFFLDFEHKHYNKKKKVKKEHKKHKENKKDSRENSKDRHKHKKRKKHHSSDKSRRHSSKHRDSCSSISSSKHGEQSTSKTNNSQANLDKSSEIVINTEKYHHKKLRKHKNDGQKHKSKSSKKLKSVIVLPTAGNNEIQKSVNRSLSSECLFPSALALINQTSTSSSQSVSPYKKHSSGHKKSSKLIDIVPKLLDKLNSDSNKPEVQTSLLTSSDHIMTSTVTSCTPNNLFVPFLTQTSDKNDLQKSRLDEPETESNSTTNVTRESAPYHIDDSILSLENSRRCLKCGLLYIPELLDSFDICFTCKKKKVCETESRGFSNVFSELFQDNIFASTASNTNTRKNQENDNQDNTDTKSCQETSENFVIQEGTESSLRPVLNQVDLTSINGPLLDISESESDECELIVTKSDSMNTHKNDLENPLCIDITKQIHDDDLNLQSTGRRADTNVKSLLQDNTVSDTSKIVNNNPSNTSQSVTMAANSSLPWIISNSPTPSSENWLGFKAPSSSLHSSQSTLQPIFPYSIPSIYSFPSNIYAGHRQPIYSNSDFLSGYSSRNCSSFINDLHADNCTQKKPVFIDLDDHKETITTSALPVFSSEKICLSDSEDSTSADPENVCARTGLVNSQNVTSTQNLLLLNDSTDMTEEDLSDDETAYEMDTDQDCCEHDTDQDGCERDTDQDGCERDTDQDGCERDTDQDGCERDTDQDGCERDTDQDSESDTNKIRPNDECNSQSEKYACSGNVINDVDMTSTSEWLEDAFKRKENQSTLNTQEKKDYKKEKLEGEKRDEENELSTSDLDCEMSTQVSEVPSSLDKKLEGMTEFSSSVLQGIEKDNRLTFHNILSEAKCGNSSNVNDCIETEEESKLSPSNQSKVDSSDSNIDSLPHSLEFNTDNFPQSNSLFVHNSEYQMDNLVSNMNGNLNSIDEFEIDSLRANSASINSKDNLYKFMYENGCNRGVRSPTSVTMETDPVENIEMNYDSSMSKPFSIPLFPFEAISGSYVSDSITQGSTVISPELNNQLPSADSEQRSDDDKRDENGQDNKDNDDQLTITDDLQDTTNDTENLIGSNLTEFSSESDRENDFTNGSDDSSSSKTVKFRVDILHSERDLSNNFANIFESSDSN
ncbi:TOPORS [Mytilus edulis]|uniref:E3 ubiquitin-protein ligase Topors n=1 Tax=Mytilus edulis TaxID=6550 RepID=A0A8S3RT29_MYTED|nr:TOPORS [Mytilus edulis]